MANLSRVLIWLATSIVLGCEERAVAPSGPRGGTVDGPATGNNAHSTAPETTALPPAQCTRVKDSSSAAWKAAGENEPCVYELGLDALHNRQLCSKPDSDEVTLSCPEALGPFLGKLVQLHDVRRSELVRAHPVQRHRVSHAGQ
jgi:hypothetical protein